MKQCKVGASEIGKRWGSVLLCSLISVLALSASVYAAQEATPAASLRLQILTKAPGLTIVDVRPPADFAKSHIQGALNVPAQDIERAGLDRKAHIVVYCSEADCPLSAGAAKALSAAGYPDVALLDGGFAEWVKRGYPTQGAATTRTAEARHPRTTMEEAGAKVRAGTELALDVRPAGEFAAGHLPQARNIPLEQLDAEMAQLPKGQEILVYDRLAQRSRQAADKLEAAGFAVTELSGGYAGWVKEKRPVEVGSR